MSGNSPLPNSSYCWCLCLTPFCFVCTVYKRFIVQLYSKNSRNVERGVTLIALFKLNTRKHFSLDVAVSAVFMFTTCIHVWFTWFGMDCTKWWRHLKVIQGYLYCCANLLFTWHAWFVNGIDVLTNHSIPLTFVISTSQFLRIKILCQYFENWSEFIRPNHVIENKLLLPKLKSDGG